MKSNVFVGSNISDVQFPKNCTCNVEVVVENIEKDHFITVGKEEVGGVKPTNFRPTLEKGETFILPYGEKFLKITVK